MVRIYGTDEVVRIFERSRERYLRSLKYEKTKEPQLSLLDFGVRKREKEICYLDMIEQFN